MLESLNERQREAAECVDGPVMVFAGAGTGKTRTLTYRIAYMIGEKNIKPYNICAITFTNKATNEMRERLQNLIGAMSHSITISTFHSLCARILRVDIEKLGYTRSFEILDDEDQLKVIKDVLDANVFDKKKFTPKHMRNVINQWKCFGIKSEYDTENEIVDLYDKYLFQNNLLDFEDLLLKTHELLKNYPDVLEKYQNKYQYVLVDEFQDTNIIQYEIAKLLTEKSRNLFVVGDDDQSIYGFRGANYENIKKFQRDFRETKKFFLVENYRSTQKILDGSNRLIKNNFDREDKELFSENQGCENDVVVYNAYDENDEADYIVDKIIKLSRQKEEYKSIAVLYRSNVLSRNIELAMVRNKIPYKIFGGISYLRRREIKDILAYFKLVANNNDVFSFNRIINVPSRGLGPTTIDKIFSIKEKYNLDLFGAIDATKTLIPSSKYETLQNFKNMILKLSSMLINDDFTLVDMFNELMSVTQYEKIYDDDEDKDDRIANIQEFKSVLYKIENNGELVDKQEKLLAAFDEAVLSDDKLQNQKESNTGVTLSTIHSVKGLEYKTVFLIGLEEGIFPSMFSSSDEETLEEERRVAYVAVTRAKSKLYLISSNKRMIYGETRRCIPSRFLTEFIGSKKEKTNIETKAQAKKNTYVVGDKINHTTYGEGVIVSIDGEIGQICFSSKGLIKKFVLTHPSITKAN